MKNEIFNDTYDGSLMVRKYHLCPISSIIVEETESLEKMRISKVLYAYDVSLTGRK